MTLFVQLNPTYYTLYRCKRVYNKWNSYQYSSNSKFGDRYKIRLSRLFHKRVWPVQLIAHIHKFIEEIEMKCSGYLDLLPINKRTWPFKSVCYFKSSSIVLLRTSALCLLSNTNDTVNFVSPDRIVIGQLKYNHEDMNELGMNFFSR